MTSFSHYVFVDFENVPIIDLGVIAGKPVHVSLLIGKHQTRLDLSLVQEIQRMPGQVELVEVGSSGRNALDITLASHLGRALERAPGADFGIISKDKDFDAMIAHWQARGVTIVRESSFAALTFLQRPKPAKTGKTRPPFPLSGPKAAPPAKSPPKPKADKFAKFVAHLRNSPPANLTKLEHMLAAYYKPAAPAGGIKGLIAALEKQEIVTIDPIGTVTVLK